MSAPSTGKTSSTKGVVPHHVQTLIKRYITQCVAVEDVIQTRNLHGPFLYSEIKAFSPPGGSEINKMESLSTTLDTLLGEPFYPDTGLCDYLALDLKYQHRFRVVPSCHFDIENNTRKLQPMWTVFFVKVRCSLLFDAVLRTVH